MNRGRGRSDGYTIVESLIFLAISGVMVMSAIVLIAGQQGKTEFSQVVQDLTSRMQDLSNDIATGYSGFPLDNECQVNGDRVRELAPASTDGTDRCIFIGKVVQFAPDGNKSKVVVYPVVGTQRVAVGVEATSIKEAKPVALAHASAGQAATNPDYSSSFVLGSEATIEKIVYNDGAAHDTAWGIGFFSTFQEYSAAGLSSGSSGVELWAMGIAQSEAPTSAVDKINSYDFDTTKAHYMQRNPKNGFTICVRSASSNQIGLVVVGGGDVSQGFNTGRLTVASRIESGGTCT